MYPRRTTPTSKRVRPTRVAGTSGTRLGPVRDTGITVRPRRGPRQARSNLPVIMLIGAALAVAVMARSLGPATNADAGAAAADAAQREPTPLFATVGGLELRLPIDPGSVSALAFHQAAGSRALAMTSLVPDADMALADELHAVPPAETTPPADVWSGTCLRLWRGNREGQPDTAVDVGAEAGTAIWSPVTGRVVAVTPYKLYGEHDDYEIHISPDGQPAVDVVMIHVDDVRVAAGDRVVAGATRVASVRSMSDKIELQLAGYTANGGDHVHLQLNAIEEPGVLEPAGGS